MLLGRALCRILKNYQQNPRFEQNRSFNDDKSKIMLLGGGLEKLQGSIKEEEYFSTLNYGLFSKLRDGMGTVTKNVVKNFEEFERVLNTTNLQDSCSMNKRKNSQEEAFFLTESSDSFQLLNNRLKNDNKALALDCAGTPGKTNANED